MTLRLRPPGQRLCGGADDEQHERGLNHLRLLSFRARDQIARFAQLFVETS